MERSRLSIRALVELESELRAENHFGVSGAGWVEGPGELRAA